MSIFHLHIYFYEVSNKAFVYFLNWVVFLLMSFMSSFYILDNNFFFIMCLLQIFSLVCSLSSHILDTVFYKEGVLILMKSHLSVIPSMDHPAFGVVST